MKELEAQIAGLDFDIGQEKQRNYTYLSPESVEKYLNSIIHGTATKSPHHIRFTSHPRYSVAPRAPYESLLPLTSLPRYSTSVFAQHHLALHAAPLILPRRCADY